MHIAVDWNMIISVCILAVISFVAKQLIEIKLALKGLTTWQCGHQEQDDERHEEHNRRIAELERR